MSGRTEHPVAGRMSWPHPLEGQSQWLLPLQGETNQSSGPIEHMRTLAELAKVS